MANIDFLQPEPSVPDLPGGRIRRSVVLDSAEFAVIRRRQQLNERLLDATCGFDRGIEDEARFGLDDLELLLQVTRERFGGEGALLRRKAVQALGQIPSEMAVRRLTDLALSPLEHDGVRITAITSLGREAAKEILNKLADDHSPAVREHVGRVIDHERVERRHRPGEVPRERDPQRLAEDPYIGRVARPDDPC